MFWKCCQVEILRVLVLDFEKNKKKKVHFCFVSEFNCDFVCFCYGFGLFVSC